MEIASKIPKRAKLVFKGQIWSVFQWKERLFDGSTAVFEGLKKAGTAKIIATSNGKIIMTRERQPGGGWYYSLLGGRLEEGETPLEGAKRELLEEAGMKAEGWKLVETMDLLKYPRIDNYVYLFVAKNCKKIMKPKLEAGEKIVMQEVNFTQFIKNIKKSKDRLGSIGEFLNSTQKVARLRSHINGRH